MWPGPCLISFIYSSNMAYLACTRHHPRDGHITCPLNTSLSHLRAFARALSTLPPPAGLSLPFQSLLQCSFLQEAYPDQIMQTRPFPTDTEFCVSEWGVGWSRPCPAPSPALALRPARKSHCRRSSLWSPPRTSALCHQAPTHTASRLSPPTPPTSWARRLVGPQEGPVGRGLRPPGAGRQPSAKL